MKDTEINTRIHILDEATPLFAAQGYNGVSMRDLSKAVGISAAALYHHFSDKRTLYLEVMKHSFVDKATAFARSVTNAGTAIEQLEDFIKGFTLMVNKDQNFRALVMWELLDGDEARLKLVAEEVLLEPFKMVYALIQDIDPEADHYMLTISSIWLVLSHSTTAPMCQYLPGWETSYSNPSVISAHVIQLLKNNINPVVGVASERVPKK
ncbi:MAG: TetR/AcrR family transcriptional regulator [Cycloclasticus sp.]|jgi:AcrR family transcriptional regulator|nr:TetR/AcrR family transcriptional regulator [Cycloclasticus sp.]MEE4290561.1 TetR/AcrR family transcriptional regulator [Cycloclasticus sp.]